jgi:hypothetical protein
VFVLYEFLCQGFSASYHHLRSWTLWTFPIISIEI